MQDSVSIPTDLDRALALAVLDELRRLPFAAPADATPTAVDLAVGRIVNDLRAQGALTREVLLALDDAFAALLAGRDSPSHRDRVRALGDQARALATARLGASDRARRPAAASPSRPADVPARP